MKKILFILYTLLLISCSNKYKQDSNDVSQQELESNYDNGIDDCSYWTPYEYIDQFGESNGKKCFIYEAYGKFSDTMADSEPLKVQIIVDDEEVFFKFYLYKGERLMKNRGLLYTDVKFNNGETTSFVLHNQGLGDIKVVPSSASPKKLRNIFLNDGPIKFSISNDKMRPTAKYNFTYDGQAWDFEQSINELGYADIN